MLATAEKVIVGYVLSLRVDRPMTPFTQAKRILGIAEIVVREEWRRQGVVTRLLDAAIDAARKESISWFELSVWEFNVEARRFVEH